MFLFRPPVLAALVLILAGCARHREPIAIVSEPAPVVALAPPAPPPVSAINRGLSPAATVWHLRVALNVAALACRGGPELQIIADYNALLRTQKGSLAAAQAALGAEFKGRGGDWQDAYDDAMTRLYNFFSQAQARDAFCQAAADVLARTRTLAEPELGGFAQANLLVLDAPFARVAEPRPAPATLLVAAASAPVYAVASAPTPPSPPRLGVNVAALGE
jgi:hypothetical protein